MLWHAGVGLKACSQQFITRLGGSADLHSQQDFMEWQTGDRGSNLAGSINLQANTRSE